MKATKLVEALNLHIYEHGDCDIEISVMKAKEGEFENQGYISSGPSFVEHEVSEDGAIISIRDWPY